MARLLDAAFRPIARWADRDYGSAIGIRNMMRMGRVYTRLRFGKYMRFRKRMYRDHFDELLRENGAPSYEPPAIQDGIAVDTTGRLPHLREMIADANRIIAERGGVKRKFPGDKFIGADQQYFQEIDTREDYVRYPSLVDFATSSEVLSVVCRYLGFIPVLSSATPPAIRLLESWDKFDPDATAYYGSQLYHLDHHDTPMMYVMVPLVEVTDQHGPFTYLGDADSAKVAAAVNYRARGRHFRISDEDVYRVVDRAHVQQLDGPARSKVLFMDVSRCLHYGSRDTLQPRYQMMYAYLSPCRTNFTDLLRPGPAWLRPPRPTDSRLKKMLLARHYLE